MPVRLWALIMTSRWVVVIPSVINIAITSSSGSYIPPDPATDAAADSPAAPAVDGFVAIRSAALLKYYCACRFASVSPSQGCCPDLRRIPLNDLCGAFSTNLCHTFLSDLCHAFSPDLCHALLLDFCRALSPDFCRALSPELCHALLPALFVRSHATSVVLYIVRSHANSFMLSVVRSRPTSCSISVVLLCPIVSVLLFQSLSPSFVQSSSSSFF